MSELESYRVMIDAASSNLERVIDSVPEDVFGKRPAPDANPISFVYFHVLRHWDRDVNMHILAQDANADAWHRDGFGDLMGYTPDGKGTNGLGSGYGYTAAEVDEVPANKAALMSYHRTLKADTDAALASLDDQTVRGERMLPQGGTISIAGRLQHLIAHTFVHVGDIEYIKGLVGAPAADVPTLD
jgi:hypothetical protein